jgi:hypothetical protein
MPPRILILSNLLLFCLMACSTAQTVEPAAAQSALATAWHKPHHTVWTIDWPAAPGGGALTVESWRASDRYRFEILEATAPALVGQTLIFDGQKSWRGDRFEPGSVRLAAEPWLSPVSEAFAVVDRLLACPATAATEQASSLLNHGLARKISVRCSNSDTLTMWLDQATGLPLRIQFSIQGDQADLQARYLEPLLQPPAGLFAPNPF